MKMVYELDQVCKSRPDPRSGKRLEVLRGISAGVPEGALVTIIGPSGAGKSTLLSLFNRMEDPDRGMLLFRGKTIGEWDVLELRRRAGLVFQHPVMLEGSVEDNILYGPRLLKREQEVDTTALIREVGLPEAMLSRPADQLSGGEQQRVALARTLANHPEVLLLDEVTSSLDLESVQVIEELILRLNGQGLTCLWVTHDLAQARRLDGETWVMIDGRLVESGPTAAIFAGKCNPLTGSFLAGKLGQNGRGGCDG